MNSNLRLVVWGLLIGLLSAFYPRLPAYLPYSITSRLPFLSSSLLHPELSKTWQSVQRYQHGVPISPNYDHGPEARWEEEIEKQLRFGSKEGGREMDKELKRVRKQLEKRTQEAGKENMIKDSLPVYYLERDLDLATAAAVGREINALVPLSVIVLAPQPSQAQSLLIASSSTLSYSPSPKLAQTLLRSFAKHAPNPVSAVSSTLVTLSSTTSDVINSLALDSAIKLTVIAVPVSQNRNDGLWTQERLWDVGQVLHELRHSHHDHHHVHNPKKRPHPDERQDDGPFSGARAAEKGERDLLELTKRTVVIAIGNVLEPRASPSLARSLWSALTTTTSHARSVSLSALYNAAAGHKPTRSIDPDWIGLILATEAAGEGEAEVIDEDEMGKAWRFGGLPIR
ncbi:uncharacterized protein JCM15063_004842 [Sporobolomyces koalae]|uniref:uncharacterized protein n=1 Tax=Sporobolomyces koalae TaxID=500713 RepID=UPI00317C6D9C